MGNRTRKSFREREMFRCSQIKCNANATLSYCWFQGPGETTYDISQLPGSTKLHLGECELLNFRADRNLHNGMWSCNVGVVNGTEEHRKFNVRVTGES